MGYDNLMARGAIAPIRHWSNNFFNPAEDKSTRGEYTRGGTVRYGNSIWNNRYQNQQLRKEQEENSK
jgi:hypothetical protein